MFEWMKKIKTKMILQFKLICIIICLIGFIKICAREFLVFKKYNNQPHIKNTSYLESKRVSELMNSNYLELSSTGVAKQQFISTITRKD